MRRLIRRPARWGLTGAALAAAACLPTAPAHAADATPAVDLRLDEVAPGWVTGGDEVRLTASVHGTEVGATDLRVTVSTASPLTSRQEVSTWLDGGDHPGRDRIAVEELESPAAGKQQELALTLQAPATQQPVGLPVVVTVSGEVDGERQVIDLQRTVVPVLPEGGAVEPTTRLGWVLPTTVPLDAGLFTASSEDREAAWSDAVSASPSVAAATRLGDRVTPLVDPALVPHLGDDQAEAVLTASAGGAWHCPRHGLRPLALRAGEDALWERATASGDGANGPLVLDLSSSTGRLGSDDPLLRELVATTGPDTAVLAPAGFRDESTDSGPGAAQDPGNWWEDRRVGWVDQAMSHHLTTQAGDAAGDQGGTAVPTQAVLGLSLFTGTEGELHDLVLLPDPGSVDAEALSRAVDAAESAPWALSMPASELLACTADGCPAPPREGTAQWPAIEPDEEFAERPADFDRLSGDAAALATVTTGSRRDLLLEGPVALLSDQWEDDRARTEALTELRRGIAELLGALDVEESTVNLLADSAELRATVANGSPTTFENLRVQVSPGNYRVTVDQPEGALGLGPRGRASTAFTAEAHAAGKVPLRITVTTPDGQRVLARGEVVVNARPSDGWWYAGIGIVTALFIGFGAWRTVRQVRAGASPPSSEAGAPR